MSGETAAGSILISRLCKSYRGQAVLSDLCLTLERGRSYCLMGPSGIGKTTLLRILMGLETADSGSVSGPEGGRVSAVFQENRLLEGYSAAENVALVTGKLYTGDELQSALLLLLPPEALNRPVREFSGGMKRRVAIVRALLAPSRLLLLDEPFTGLDEEMKGQTAAFILARRGDRTLLMVSHDEREAAMLGAEIIRI